MTRRVRFLALPLMLLCNLALAATPVVFEHPATPAQLRVIIAKAEQELARVPVLRGQFTQIKTLQEIPAPLKSTGRFIISRTQGIYWHTLTPFDSEFILTPTQMLQVDGGKVAVRIDAATQPGLKVVGDVFFSIFNLDPAALASNFTLYGMSAAKGWVMGLRPRNSALGSLLTEAVITGDRRVSKVNLLDAHGDRTEITLENTTGTAALTPQEAALFHQ
ncbi:MAG: outer membrane lipoprotein carrier protein LolA [Stenotrophobium sp.]